MTHRLAVVDNVGRRAGMDYYDISLLRSLARRGSRCSLFSNFTERDAEIEYRPYFDARASGTLSKGLDFFRGYVRSFRDCRRDGTDAVILHLFSTSWEHVSKVILAKLFRLRLILIVHDISSFGRRDSPLGRRFIFHRLADAVVVHNRFSYDRLSELLTPAVMRKVHIIRHGNYLFFPLETVSKQAAAQRLGLDPEFFYLLFFGQIKRVKGLDTLLAALPQVDMRARLIIAGRPWKDDFRRYQNLIDRLSIGERVIPIIRFVTDEEKNLLFSLCDAVVLPYRLIFQSGVLLMAMSYGRAVVASDIPGNSEVVREGENGLLFPAGDEAALARQVNRLVRNEKLVARLSIVAERTARKEYAWEDIAASYLEVLDGIVV